MVSIPVAVDPLMKSPVTLTSPGLGEVMVIF